MLLPLEEPWTSRLVGKLNIHEQIDVTCYHLIVASMKCNVNMVYSPNASSHYKDWDSFGLVFFLLFFIVKTSDFLIFAL